MTCLGRGYFTNNNTSHARCTETFYKHYSFIAFAFSLQDFQVGNITLNYYYYYYYIITLDIEIDSPKTHTTTADRHERKFKRPQPCLCIPNNDGLDRRHITRTPHSNMHKMKRRCEQGRQTSKGKRVTCF